MPSRAAAMLGAAVLAAFVRRGTLGTDPEVLGLLADLVLYVTEGDMDEIARLNEYIARLKSELAQAERRRADLERENEDLRHQLDAEAVRPFPGGLRPAA